MSKKWPVILFFTLFSFTPGIQAPDPGELRSLFKTATTDQCKSEGLYNAFAGTDMKGKPVWMAYKGAARTMMADCVFSPLKKQSYFSEGKALIETAVQQAPENIEIRFLRFIIQSHLPGFLDYDMMADDRKFLCRAIPEAYSRGHDRDYLRDVCAMMIASGKLSINEKEILQKLR